MSTNPNPPEPSEDDSRLTAYLYDLMDIGAKIAQSVGRQAELQAQPTPEGETAHPAVDVADQFERVARAMRRTALLIRHIAQNRASHTPPRTQARKRIIREVEDAIQRWPGDPKPLQAELLDRLDSPDLEEEIATRPVAEIILDICRDLGLENMPGNHPWERRTPRDIETLRLRAATPKSPAPYTPALHGPDLRGPDLRGPNLRDPDLRDPDLRGPDPPDTAQGHRQPIAMTKRLAQT